MSKKNWRIWNKKILIKSLILTSIICSKWDFLFIFVNSSDVESKWNWELIKKYIDEKFYERSLNDIRESNAGDKLHFDLGFKGVDWLWPCQFSRISLEAKIFT